MTIENGFPMDHRDRYGARAIHLVDNNIEFLLNLRKITKKYARSRKIINRHPKREQQ